MQIQKINYSINKPVFTGWERDVYRKDKTNPFCQELKHRNDTFFYRDGAFWPQFIDFVDTKYKDVPKVNVYSYGCSNGSEPYTFVMQMLSAHPESADKFLPVTAKDYDKVAIRMAKSHCLPIDTDERMLIQRYTNNIDRFISIPKANKILGPHVCFYPLKPELTDKVNFSVANVLYDTKKIKPNNSIVMVRNFWPYLADKDVYKLANMLGERLNKNSVLVFGTFDLSTLLKYSGIDLHQILEQHNFLPTKLVNVFEKIR